MKARLINTACSQARAPTAPREPRPSGHGGRNSTEAGDTDRTNASSLTEVCFFLRHPGNISSTDGLNCSPLTLSATQQPVLSSRGLCVSPEAHQGVQATYSAPPVLVHVHTGAVSSLRLPDT